MEIWKHKFEVKKDRWVYVPSDEMIDFGTKLHIHIISKWKPPLYYYHFRNGGHVLAGRQHLSNEFFALIDIKSFFESTTQSRVTRELKTLFPYEKARKISKISTVRVPTSQDKKFAIPYGFPQSPILATLCFHNSYAGRILDSLYKSGLITVSIYMDDIILSCKDMIHLQEKYDEMCEALVKSRYEINKSKSQPPSFGITVFNLEISNKHYVVTPSRMVEFIQDYAQAENQYVREGIATYVHTVSPAQANLHFPNKPLKR